MRVPGGGASCLGVGRLGTGALPPPTLGPYGRAAGAHYPLAVGAGGAGVGTRHQPHSARSCVLSGRHEGARGGRQMPGYRASGDGCSPTPDHPSFRTCGRGPLPTGCGCGVQALGPGCPWHLVPCRGSSCVVRASRVRGTRCPLLLGTCPRAVVVAGGVPLWRASWPRVGALLLVRSGRSRCSGRLSRRRGVFPQPGGCRPRLYWVAARGTWRPAENRAHCACRSPLPRQGRWARSASYPFRALRWGCPWRVPPASVLGCMRCGGLACVDPVTDASGFPYRPSCDGGLGRCTGAVPCGRRHRPLRIGGRHAQVPSVCACACPGRAGRPPGRVLVRLTFPLAVLGLLFACWAPSGLGLPCLWLLSGFFFFLFPLPPPSLRPRCVLLCVFSGPGCPQPWRLVAPPLFLAPPPCCLWRFLLSGCLGPLRPPPPLFFCLYFRLFLVFPFSVFFSLFFFAGCAVWGGVHRKPEPKHTHPRRAPKPGVAGCKQSAHTSTRQEWRGAAETRAQTHTPTPRTKARSGGVQAERPHQHTPGVAGRSRNPSPNTHTHGAHPSQEPRGASGAPTPAHARSGGVHPKPEPKHTHPRRVPKPGLAGCKRSAHTSTRQEWRGAAETRAQTHTPTARTQARSGGVQAECPHQHTPGVAGCSLPPRPNTHTHGAHPSQEWRDASGASTPAHAGSGGVQPKPEPKHTHPRRAPKPGVAGCKQSAHTSTHTAQQPSQEWRGAAETRAQTHTLTARTQAKRGGVQAERPHQHTPGVAGCSRNPSPNIHTHGAHPSQEWRGASKAPTPAPTQPNTPARSGGVQPKPEPKHTHPRRAPKPGEAGCKRSAHTSTRQEWRGADETRAQKHTPTGRTQARSGGMQAERPHQHTPGVGVCSRNSSLNAHTRGAHPSQMWRGASGAQLSTRQEWRDAAETRAQTHTPTARTQARRGGVQAERPHQHTPGVAGCSRNPSTNTHTHGRAPKPGVAGCRRGAHTSTRQDWRGAAETRAQTHTPTARTQARSGGVQAERPQQHTPGVAGRSRNLSPNTHTHGAQPSQEWRGASGAPKQAHTKPNTPARSCGAQPKPEPKHTQPRRASQLGVARCKRSAHTSTHTAQHPSQEWRGAAETRARTHTPRACTPARSGGVQAERPHQQTRSPTADPGVAGCRRKTSPNTHTPTAHPRHEWRGTRGARTQTCTPEHPGREWRGTAETRAQAHTPTPRTPAKSCGVQGEQAHKHAHPDNPARSGGVQVDRAHEHTHSSTPQPKVAGRSRSPSPTHTPTPRTPARSGRVQVERANEKTHSPTARRGVAGRSRNPSPSTRTQAAHPSQETRGTERARTPAHTHLNTQARGGGAQPKPEPKCTNQHRTTQAGVAGYRGGTHTSTHTPQHPSQEWRGAAET